MPGNDWLIVRANAMRGSNDTVEASCDGWRRRMTCVPMIFVPATMSRTIANERVARRLARRRRRPRHRHDRHYRPDQLVFRHRSERAAQRRADPHRRRIEHATERHGAAGYRRHAATTRPASSSRWCSATPKTAGRKSSRPAAAPIIRRSCACSAAPSRAAAAWRSRPWDRSTARTISASISTPRSSTICRDKFGGCANSNACKFSEAYVIAHEVGHHVQDELGILPRVTPGAAGVRQQGRSKTRCRSASSCRPIASPASGRTARSKSTISSIRATSIRRCRPRPPSATTACKKKRKAMSCPTPSPMALRSSASAGSCNGFKKGDVAACNTFVGEPALVLLFAIVPRRRESSRRACVRRRRTSGCLVA